MVTEKLGLWSDTGAQAPLVPQYFQKLCVVDESKMNIYGVEG